MNSWLVVGIAIGGILWTYLCLFVGWWIGESTRREVRKAWRQ